MPSFESKAANKSFYAAFNVEPDQILGKELAYVANGQWNIPALLAPLSDLSSMDGEFDDLEIEHPFPAMGNRMMLVGARLLAGDTPQNKLILLSLRDVREAAEAVREYKTEFLPNISHQIRTPMSAIVGFAEMLLVQHAKKAQQDCIQGIQRNASQLLELIDGVLDLSKIEAGQMIVDCISCDLPALLADIASIIRPGAIEKGLWFGLTFHGSIPQIIQTDPLRLRQILLILVGNALRFTESGKIELRITDEGAGGPHIALRIDVIDSGIGMLPEQIEQLFQFTPATDRPSLKLRGAGLGLTVSQRVAKLLNGDLTVTSQPSLGSTFTLRIDGGPIDGVQRLLDLTETKLPALRNRGVPANINLRGRILLVEDGDDNQVLLQLQLSRAGAEVVVAQDGQVAVDLATTKHFDLILMDIQMPVMDGYQATSELRRRGVTIPIIALTAYAMAEDRDKCLASGCSAFLTKPVEEETLLETIYRHLGNKISNELEGQPLRRFSAAWHGWTNGHWLR